MDSEVQKRLHFLEVVRNNGHLLKYASDELRNNKKIVLAAVTQDGYALQCFK